MRCESRRILLSQRKYKPCYTFKEQNKEKAEKAEKAAKSEKQQN